MNDYLHLSEHEHKLLVAAAAVKRLCVILSVCPHVRMQRDDKDAETVGEQV